MKLTRLSRPMLAALLAVALFAVAADAAHHGDKKNALTKKEKEEGFKLLFNGKDLKGWKVSENPKSTKVENGNIICQGKRAHVWYVADGGPKDHPKFKNFEFRAKVYIHPNSNSGIYIHNVYTEKGWPLSQGYEAQVCSNGYRDPKKTGSVYNYKNLSKSAAPDEKWFDYTIIVKGRTVQTIINGKLAAEYTEPDDKPTRLKGGTFALQCHDPKSKVEYHTIRVRELPEEKKD